MSTRKNLKSVYGHRYKKIISVDVRYKDICLYCGDIYQELDHQPPISTVDTISSISSGIKYALIPSCKECNSLLGSSLTYTIDERFNLLKTLLHAKYAKLMSCTACERDYTDMSGSLRRQCIAYDKKGHEVRARLAFSGYDYNGHKTLATDRFMYEGVSYDSYYDALKVGCDANFLKYKDVMTYGARIGCKDIDELMIKYRTKQIPQAVKKEVKTIKKERFPSMPKKMIDKFVDDFCLLYGRVEDIVRQLDIEYELYITRMGFKK